MGDIFAALADPTRRALVETIARDGEATATQLSAHFPISRQAVTRHLSALADAGLVTTHRVGKEQRYTVELSAMDPAAKWMHDVGALWDKRLASLTRQLARRV
jgi:DNA-binding transcriptional ArsR family regulator